MSALVQLIGEAPGDQIATEGQRRSSVMQWPPGTPQLRCRPIAQSGDFAIKPGRVSVSKSVLPAAVWTETGGRFARVLASRSIVDWRFHRPAGSAMRQTL